ncbi:MULTISPECIES: flagellar hook assembly protein FlgD [Bacillus cereus group]|uniref:flagellar hook assembly protein FlgD n=1 Tax=Bacillus cereus group TaxID=86661 RepID=UPI00086425AA|nr:MULTISPECIES: flagellar hook assembly protein FlgD [Bacillus cereus group]AWC28305.1 flagellar basal body rod modification protein [Bacillus cytotoxicus]AWC40310.1 flagellar basal body rod modification protein [Bacillus cytotoxicus]AWC48241.1 flagellar basal body rod modification protein [Bacillus cytotoxicus]AWC52372.1 flagellar basal body rod modification protein [Bacillus cytotoxicus]AWC56506.1 flagellar basal body rod modification protein [Bacillus cytotoxicus]
MPTVGLHTTNTNHLPLQAGVQTKDTKAVSGTDGTKSANTQQTPGVMGKDDFLKLFLTSLQYQDPFNAMDMNQMMNQMSQMSIMEQVQNMTKAVDSLRTTMYTTALDGGMKFLGKYVRGVDNNGQKVSGQVDIVRLAANNEVQLVVDKHVVSLRFVESVSDEPISETNLVDEKQEGTEETEKVKAEQK